MDTFSELSSSIDEVAQRIWDDLNERIYLQLDSKNANLYDPKVPPFGTKVADNFPSAIDDIVEAGNCLALERNTAAVFHLMRVMESALNALAAELGIPYAPSWEAYIRQLSKVIEGDWKSMPSDVRRKQSFYKEILGDLQAIKIAWRNPTMHIVRSYGSPEARRIYDCIQQFMTVITEEGLAEA